jgi:hypothetical protein
MIKDLLARFFKGDVSVSVEKIPLEANFFNTN